MASISAVCLLCPAYSVIAYCCVCPILIWSNKWWRKREYSAYSTLVTEQTNGMVGNITVRRVFAAVVTTWECGIGELSESLLRTAQNWHNPRLLRVRRSKNVINKPSCRRRFGAILRSSCTRKPRLKSIRHGHSLRSMARMYQDCL